MFTLGLSAAELIQYAANLGSDCPFFMLNKPCFATGRGEIMEELALNLSGYRFVLVNGGLPVNTTWAFSQMNVEKRKAATGADKNLKDIILLPPGTWKDKLTNDFEQPVFDKYPVIQSIKDRLYAHGALYASMSGSGSTVFGIFEKKVIPVLDFPAEYWVKEIEV
jgi:4-diphosphocytidyl-2-C-methyl-D-erythritol kinase